MDRLAGKVAIITGAASGIGEAQARLFVAEGARVLLADIDANGKRVAADLGKSAIFIRHDVRSEEAWVRLIKTAEEAFGTINILVNTAGVNTHMPFEQYSKEMYECTVGVNQTGVFLGMRTVIEPMTRAGGGAIVNVSSAGGIRAVPNMIGYVASKFAVRGLTKCAALELAPRKIRVNAILPGIIDTPLSRRESKQNDTIIAMTPMGRLGLPEEIAAATLFLVSDEASFITGIDLPVDGGMTA